MKLTHTAVAPPKADLKFTVLPPVATPPKPIEPMRQFEVKLTSFDPKIVEIDPGGIGR